MTTNYALSRRRDEKRKDPRVQRTLKLLGDALMELIIEKGYEAVSVQDITDRANTSRTTFYLHFKDKDELLFETMRAMYDDLVATTHKIDFSDTAAAIETMCEPVEFDHVLRYLRFYKVMLSEKGSMTFLLRVWDYLANEMLRAFQDGLPPEVKPRIPTAFLAHMAAGAEIAVVRWWINNDLPYSAQEMANFLYQAHANGIWWSLGITEQPV